MSSIIKQVSDDSLNQIQTINDDFFLLQLILETKMELTLKKAITDAKTKSLEAFRQKFIPAYSIEKEAFALFRKELNKWDWFPRCDHVNKSFYVFKFMKIPTAIKKQISKATGSISTQVVNVVSEINVDPFIDSLTKGLFDAVKEGGISSFIIFDIGAPFNLRDVNVEQFLKNYEIQLAKAITDQIESAIRFEILEGVRAGESVSQISIRIQGVWDKPIQVNVPPRLSANGEVIRAGYSYALDIETWATTVARTETARGFIEGKLDGYRQTGVVNKVQFVVTPDERLCPTCSILEGAQFKLVDAGGIIPVHPSCRCTFIPLVELNTSTKATALDNVIAVSA